MHLVSKICIGGLNSLELLPYISWIGMDADIKLYFIFYDFLACMSDMEPTITISFEEASQQGLSTVYIYT